MSSPGGGGAEGDEIVKDDLVAVGDSKGLILMLPKNGKGGDAGSLKDLCGPEDCSDDGGEVGNGVCNIGDIKFKENGRGKASEESSRLEEDSSDKVESGSRSEVNISSEVDDENRMDKVAESAGTEMDESSSDEDEDCSPEDDGLRESSVDKVDNSLSDMQDDRLGNSGSGKVVMDRRGEMISAHLEGSGSSRMSHGGMSCTAVCGTETPTSVKDEERSAQKS